ncbi:hypothetical protein LguiA_011389 [Lonicera macranthoides]
MSLCVWLCKIAKHVSHVMWHVPRSVRQRYLTCGKVFVPPRCSYSVGWSLRSESDINLLIFRLVKTWMAFAFKSQLMLRQ